MLQFGLAAALEVLHAAIGGEACGIPKSDWVLHTELVPEITQEPDYDAAVAAVS